MLTDDQLRPLLAQAFTESTLPLPDKRVGKVRDNYQLSKKRRLLVTTDRLSAFDRVLNCVPYKGQVLNQLTAWWFKQLQDIFPNHLLEVADPNAQVVVEVTPFPIEVIVRGYITGVTSTALWHRYSLGEREIYGYSFPEGLQKNQALPQPLITPTTKGGITGHDERLTCAEVVSKGYLDAAIWEKTQAAALAIFQRGLEVAKRAGLLLVDTKYEFGITDDGQVLLIDEVHTPDSSRFWRAESYASCFAAGTEPENFDKELVRLAYAEYNYRGDGIPPTLPDELWLMVSQRYIQIYQMLTGNEFVPGAYPVSPRLQQNLKARGLLT